MVVQGDYKRPREVKGACNIIVTIISKVLILNVQYFFRKDLDLVEIYYLILIR